MADFGTPTRIEITPINEKTKVRFRLHFDGRRRSVEFRMGTDDAMVVMRALQRLQALHKFPIPQTEPPGKPKLRVVEPEE